MLVLADGTLPFLLEKTPQMRQLIPRQYIMSIKIIFSRSG